MRRAVLMVVTALAVLLPASPAAAWICGPLDTSGAPVVLVGTVEAAGSRHARFAVEEVWAGPDLAPVVRLETGVDPMDGSIYLSRGERYVVTADESFRTGYCQVSLVDEGVTRPADVRRPVADGVTGWQAPPSMAENLAWGASGTTLVAGVLLLARRRRRRVTGASEEVPCAEQS